MIKPTGRKIGRPSTWTNEQLEILRECCGKVFAKELAYRLEKTANAVRSKARELGMSSAVPGGKQRVYNYRRPNPAKVALPVHVTKEARIERMVRLAEIAMLRNRVAA